MCRLVLNIFPLPEERAEGPGWHGGADGDLPSVGLCGRQSHKLPRPPGVQEVGGGLLHGDSRLKYETEGA